MNQNPSKASDRDLLKPETKGPLCSKFPFLSGRVYSFYLLRKHPAILKHHFSNFTQFLDPTY